MGGAAANPCRGNMRRGPDTGYPRPFLKWAGGKRQLLGELCRFLPPGLGDREISRYVEPFVGGGAMFFALSGRFPAGRCTICDINEDIVLTYRVVGEAVGDLVPVLAGLESEYLSRDAEGRKTFYYDLRDRFNREKQSVHSGDFPAGRVGRAAQVIFLNRTCYNGLFRTNRKGEFNVPFGRYRKPDILNGENLRAASGALAGTRILPGDFSSCRPFVDERTFVYLDPPYRPVSETSFFTAYTSGGFPEEEQVRLASFFRELDSAGAKVMLSNSDPRDRCPGDDFFDTLYEGFTIRRVPARRIINSDGARRGEISELVITNY